MTKSEYLAEFYRYYELSKELGSIENIDEFKQNIPHFLLHMMHLKAYDFAKTYCKKKRVLEIGCNMGYGANVLKDIAEEIVAIDFDSRAIRIAREYYAASNIKFEQVNATSLPFDINSFDVVTSFQIIEHMRTTEVYMFLSEINRVLKKGGVALLTTPNRKLRLYPFQRPCNPDHHTEYTAKGFFKKLKTVFKDVQILGLRAEEWIEDIERNRINNSLYRAFIWGPMKTILEIALPDPIVHKLKGMPIKSRLKPHEAQRSSPTLDDFDVLAGNFSIDSLWFDKTDLDNSLYFLGINEKNIK